MKLLKWKMGSGSDASVIRNLNKLKMPTFIDSLFVFMFFMFEYYVQNLIRNIGKTTVFSCEKFHFSYKNQLPSITVRL